MSTSLYHIAVNSQVSGPFTALQIRNMWQTGSITADALCIQEGDTEWLPLRGLNDLLDGKPAAVAVTREDPFAALHTPIRGKSEGSLTWIGWAGCVIGVLSAPFVLLNGIGLPGVLLGIAAYLWCRKPKAH